MFEKVKKVVSKLIYAVPVVVFLGFIFYITTMTYTEEKPGMVRKNIAGTQFNFDSFVDLSAKLEKVLQKDIYERYRFINLNGRIAKYLGFNSLNNVKKLANGHLTWLNSSVMDVTQISKNTIELNNFLTERNIPFLYIIVPDKSSMYDIKFAPGYGDESWKNLRNMVENLTIAQVDILDMNLWFKENHWHMDDVFFRTDHHWKPRAGLVTAQLVMELLQRRGLAAIDEKGLQEKDYKIRTLKNQFLGTHGKRTGKKYAGMDDISIYYPRFNPKFSYSGLHRNTTNWDYSRSLLNQGLIKRKDYFEVTLYSIYMYGELPLQIVSNSEAVNNKRVLIVGDSDRRVWQYFLATQFQQTYCFDVRYYTDGSLAQYIEEIKPDLVLMLTRAGFEKDLFNFGIKEYNQALAETNPNEPSILIGDFEVLAQEGNNNNFVTVGRNLEPAQTYTLTVDGIEVLKGQPRHIQLTLIDQTTNKPITNHYFEPGKEGKQKWIFAVPETSNNYGLYLYAGTKGHTAHNSIKMTNILLKKGIHEDQRIGKNLSTEKSLNE